VCRHLEAAFIATFIHQLLTGQTPVVQWDGEQVRDYVYVTDIARANLLAAFGGDGRTYNIGTGVRTSVTQVLSLLCDVSGVHTIPRRAPQATTDIRTAYFDPTRARTELGWQPTVELRTGLEKTVEHFRRRLPSQHSEAVSI
jgi:UDP-glucose 4-epimerase